MEPPPPPPPQTLPALSQVLADFAMRVQGLCKLRPDEDARAAVAPLIAMLRRVPEAEGAQAEAAAALAQCMAESSGNRSVVEENGGVDALVALMNTKSATPPMLISACHAIHMLLRNPENCAIACQASVHLPVTKMAELARGDLSDGATPAAGTLCHLAESSAHARTLLREAGSAEPLASLVLVDGGESAAAKFAGFALLSLVQEEPQVVVDAVEKACRNEPQFAKSLEACCPDCLEVLQRQVLTRLKAAMEGSDIKLLQDLLALGHGINLPPGILKEAKGKFRTVMQRAEESKAGNGERKTATAAASAGGGAPSRRAASPAKARVGKVGATSQGAASERKGAKASAPSASAPSAAKADKTDKTAAAPSATKALAASATTNAGSGGAYHYPNTSVGTPSAVVGAPSVAAEGNGAEPRPTPMASLFGASEGLMDAGHLLNEGLGCVRKAFEQAIVSMRADKERLQAELHAEREKCRALAAQLAATQLLAGQGAVKATEESEEESAVHA